MLRDYLARRLTLFFFMLLLLSAFTFSLAYLFPGEAVSNLSGVQSPNSFERDALEQKYALDKSYFSQYIKFITHIFHGDWGA
ncbi:ABC transporter permease, partial [Pseudoalteromonas sp. G4]|nr:ABC transporter permease [Pseudoalteromonas sp. G4]